MLQPRPNLASQNNIFFSQNPVSTDSNQPTQVQNEILLPYYFQQHEITKINLQIFHKCQMPQNHFK